MLVELVMFVVVIIVAIIIGPFDFKLLFAFTAAVR